MNAAQVLGYFDQISEAEDAIPSLRRFILGLAVRGKLVPQNPTDQTAAKALDSARRWLGVEAQRMGRQRWKPSAPVLPQDVAVHVPTGWVPARVNDTGFYINGLAFKPSDWAKSGLPIIRIQNLTDEKREFNFAQGRFPKEVIVQDGDLLVSWSATLEAFKWTRGTGVLNQHIFRVIPAPDFVHKDYLLLLLRSAIRDMADSEHAHGLVMTHINRGPFTAHVVLIPPYAEQLRIVEKVGELTALCDQLEVARNEREATRTQLTTASLARLNEPDPDPAAFADHARFALDNIDSLTVRIDQIRQLRQTIVSLAVRGKLVPQNSSDEPASELLRRVSDKKAQLVKQGVLTASRSNAAFAADGQPYPVCSGWEWVRLGDIADVQDPNPSHRMPHYVTTGGVPFISSENFSTNDGIDFSIGKRISRDTLREQVERFPILPGAIGLTRIGTIGKTRFLPPDRTYGISHAVCVINPVDASLVNMRFVRLALGVDSILSFAHKGTRSIGVPDLGMAVIRSMALPFPPYAEQRRIVAKVDQLMTLCDRLEASLSRGEESRGHLLEAVLHEVLIPTTEEAA